MKLFVNYFNSLKDKPSFKFSTNLFFLKNNFYFNHKLLNHIHFFYYMRNRLQIKTLKFNYNFYKNFIIYFIFLNLMLQLILILLIF